MHPQQIEERRRLAVARIEDAAHRLAALNHRRYLTRETIDETDPRQAILRETEITADALDFIVALLLPQPVWIDQADDTQVVGFAAVLQE